LFYLNGSTTVLTSDAMARGPDIDFPSIVDAAEARAWIDSEENNVDGILDVLGLPEEAVATLFSLQNLNPVSSRPLALSPYFNDLLNISIPN
jgi:hypothetical protein